MLHKYVTKYVTKNTLQKYVTFCALTKRDQEQTKNYFSDFFFTYMFENLRSLESSGMEIFSFAL